MINSLHPYIGTLGLILIKIVCLLVAIAYFTIAERKIMAAIQRRRGPNVVGVWGLLQPAADGLKLIAKEMIIPSHANSRIFVLAPLVVLTLSLLTWSVMPFSLYDHSEYLPVVDLLNAARFNTVIVFTIPNEFLTLEVIGLLLALKMYFAWEAAAAAAFPGPTEVLFLLAILSLVFWCINFLIDWCFGGVINEFREWCGGPLSRSEYEPEWESVPAPGLNNIHTLPLLTLTLPYSDYNTLIEANTVAFTEFSAYFGMFGGGGGSAIIWWIDFLLYWWIWGVMNKFRDVCTGSGSRPKPESTPEPDLDTPKAASLLALTPSYSDYNTLIEANTVGDTQYGILIVLALSSLSVYGLILSGWSSNSKYAFLGALRSAAQMISYEVAISLVLLPLIAVAGALNFIRIIYAQTMSSWFVGPMLQPSGVFIVSMVAETNRTPFDLPEAEAELVAGYNIEYSSIIFAMFFLAEYGNMSMMSLLKAMLFLGGGGDETVERIPQAAILTFKGLFFCFLFVLIRASFPRYRYDQLMDIGWKVFLPISTGYFVYIVGALVAFDASPLIQELPFLDYCEGAILVTLIKKEESWTKGLNLIFPLLSIFALLLTPVTLATCVPRVIEFLSRLSVECTHAWNAIYAGCLFLLQDTDDAEMARILIGITAVWLLFRAIVLKSSSPHDNFWVIIRRACTVEFSLTFVMVCASGLLYAITKEPSLLICEKFDFNSSSLNMSNRFVDISVDESREPAPAPLWDTRTRLWPVLPTDAGRKLVNGVETYIEPSNFIRLAAQDKLRLASELVPFIAASEDAKLARNNCSWWGFFSKQACDADVESTYRALDRAKRDCTTTISLDHDVSIRGLTTNDKVTRRRAIHCNLHALAHRWDLVYHNCPLPRGRWRFDQGGYWVFK